MTPEEVDKKIKEVLDKNLRQVGGTIAVFEFLGHEVANIDQALLALRENKDAGIIPTATDLKAVKDRIDNVVVRFGGKR